MKTILDTEQQKRDYAKQAAREMIAGLRQSNDEFEQRTSSPSTVPEAEYLAAERDFEAALLRVAGLKPLVVAN